ncbi:thioredoxin domain-containing protein [Gordonia soli]|uniref:Spermatogenesis-associated protein 20-like TRX domain-containing protein n=1 Tax=Gordonia soli NBRC 108243 TaxID=1223545 RepID=M0QQ03_9ACTN|nr:thioredoxin domain-containing protein [Gordonia soli]GAC70459.1 hypothetical protein GS4_35_00350 [Gordonia soli NBRC 108243]
MSPPLPGPDADRNALGSSTSPYLRQHADNPVHWQEWGDDAFATARRRDVPVLLSIGYAACHWCHVMAHESFEDSRIASLMNENFVCIKVDREERPDIDAIYMNATVSMTGQGGWPMTSFLTPEGRPFYCGTYFPPTRRGGMPGFDEILAAISTTWTERRDEVDRVGEAVAQNLTAATSGLPDATVVLDDDLLRRSVHLLADEEDAANGGFGDAPKFPPSAHLEALLRVHEHLRDDDSLAMARRAATAMAHGGIYDQLAGGFARYAVDSAWVVPHFEKMLYDNALLLRFYAHLARATGDPTATRVTREIVSFLRSDLSVAGGFASSLDADADGVEGSTYVWTPDQLVAVLGVEDGRWAADLYGVTADGTFEHGTSTLRRHVTGPGHPEDPERTERVRSLLLAARAERVQPARDDKVVTAWNALAVTALAEAGTALDERDWVLTAADVVDGLLDRHVVDGRVRRSSLGGVVGAPDGVLEDHAALVTALFAVHQATGVERYRSAGLDLLDTTIAEFGDPQVAGSWFDTRSDATGLITRPRDPMDGATPSGGALLAEALLIASTLADGARAGRYLGLADESLGRAAVVIERAPRAAGHWLAVAAARRMGPLHLTATSPTLLSAARALAPGGAVITESSAAAESAGQPTDTVMVCRETTCSLPVGSVDDLRALLEAR